MISAIGAALAIAGASAGGYALATATSSSTVKTVSGPYVSCTNLSGELFVYNNKTCAQAGHPFQLSGFNGATGAQGPAGPQGPTGPSGSNGASAVTSISAATALSNWPDTGGAGDVWGLDNFTRILNVTVEDQVNNSHCGGAPVCYAVFGTISDTGTTVPQDGTAAPNNSEPATIVAANITGISTSGAAEFQFYSTSNAISAANVPAKDNAATQGKLFSTTDWGESAFPAGTQFFDPTLTAYNWTYTAALSYTSDNTSISCTQIWTDHINPGDDGQGASDGNITGVCPSS